MTEQKFEAEVEVTFKVKVRVRDLLAESPVHAAEIAIWDEPALSRAAMAELRRLSGRVTPFADRAEAVEVFGLHRTVGAIVERVAETIESKDFEAFDIEAGAWDVAASVAVARGGMSDDQVDYVGDMAVEAARRDEKLIARLAETCVAHWPLLRASAGMTKAEIAEAFGAEQQEAA